MGLTFFSNFEWVVLWLSFSQFYLIFLTTYAMFFTDSGDIEFSPIWTIFFTLQSIELVIFKPWIVGSSGLIFFQNRFYLLVSLSFSTQAFKGTMWWQQRLEINQKFECTLQDEGDLASSLSVIFDVCAKWSVAHIQTTPHVHILTIPTASYQHLIKIQSNFTLQGIDSPAVLIALPTFNFPPP